MQKTITPGEQSSYFTYHTNLPTNYHKHVICKGLWDRMDVSPSFDQQYPSSVSISTGTFHANTLPFAGTLLASSSAVLERKWL